MNRCDTLDDAGGCDRQFSSPESSEGAARSLTQSYKVLRSVGKRLNICGSIDGSAVSAVLRYAREASPDRRPLREVNGICLS